MSVTAPTTLEAAIRQSGEGWLIDHHAPPEKAMGRIRQTIIDVQKEATQHLGTSAPTISEESLLQDYQTRPIQVRAFFQALGGSRSPQMLLLVWRIIQGMEIESVQINYRRQTSFEATVILRSPYGEADPPYHSNQINDFALFRNIGLLEIDARPVMDGYYALRVGR